MCVRRKYYVERLKRLAATPSVRIEFAAGGLQTPATAATATTTAGTLAGAMSAALAAVAAGTALNESVTPIVNATLAPAADDDQRLLLLLLLKAVPVLMT